MSFAHTCLLSVLLLGIGPLLDAFLNTGVFAVVVHTGVPCG